MSSNPLRILETLDRHLHAAIELHLYGRSALALGYPNAPAAYHATMDVDAILPAGDVRAIEANEDFWQAQARANDELGDSGLYFTHLFEEKQVILTPDWLKKTVPITGFGFRFLRVSRPSTADLLLTKLMRVDPQDREDIRFLLRQPPLTPRDVREALDQAVVPPVAEIAAAFVENRAWLVSLLEHGSP